MSEYKGLRFGDVIRVDPATNSAVPQPDSRRWMVIAFDDRHKWTIQYLGDEPGTESHDGILSHQGSLYGFVRVKDAP